jgi:hypothetical protein
VSKRAYANMGPGQPSPPSQEGKESPPRSAIGQGKPIAAATNATAQVGKHSRSAAIPEQQRKRGGNKGGKLEPPHPDEAEQTREREESRKARSADASKSVKKGHTGGR